MILPTKYLTEDRALLSLGGVILSSLNEPKTVSRLWEQIKHAQADGPRRITWEWFLLAL